MNINNLNQTSPTNVSRAATVSQPQASSNQQNIFMTLLVAQLKNQDPLAPQDGAQFVAQLAQFNSLDQLTGIRSSIEQLIALTQQNQGGGKGSNPR